MFALPETLTAGFHASEPRFGPVIQDTLPRAGFDRAEAEITTWSGYHQTPLTDLPGYARSLGLGAIHYKDEGQRFGLGSFKALGGAYAVLRVIQRTISGREGRTVGVNEILNGDYAQQISNMTMTSATDGNHGRSVAWGAQRLGAKCRIYIHSGVSPFRANALRALGADVIRIDGDYDATVAQTRVDAEEHGWMIVSDTSWPGYTQPPVDVMAGYGVMAREILRELAEPPTHVFLQGGVGGLAAAVIAVFHQEWGANAPRSIIVEPDLAPCLFASSKANAMTPVKIQEESLMAGLSCGEPSQLAWAILSQTVHGFMTIPEHLVAPTVRLLSQGCNGDPGIEAGESAVAGLIGLSCGALDRHLRNALRLDTQSRVLVIGSEGITDPEVFSAIMSGEI
ncbi:diaminopropionate ammonia-lyase [Tateyamaria omphalii]|uniref:diaminopropionate ammonia-lyase n=1 Tax=Tateyamaria omphalii TaxID=299262 RepID=UPI00167B2EA0|nr:diaminopropionate ammonia-lyase [Tateyamaria omphalii]GGX54472.1 diaminopropionate ammonia-lyase [Tateyamaria omphalii]